MTGTVSLLKTKVVTIPKPAEGERENRDAGRSYLLTEMTALKAEKWGRHAVHACTRNDLNFREEVGKLGLLGFYLLGFQALAGGDARAVDDLMDEMLTCIAIIESPEIARPLGGDGDIWEVSTILLLRKELLELHMGFTFAELASTLVQRGSAPTQADSPNTQTSPPLSET